MEEALEEQLERGNIALDTVDEPLYISIEGLIGCPSELEDDCPRENESAMNEDQLVALSTKQLNRLAAMDILPLPSGGLLPGGNTSFNPITVQWLLENYETKTGVSLPRSTVYNHYIRHCRLQDMQVDKDPVNAASFGKLIRSIFLGLQTRRLGTRGNSKYHYYGIQIKPDSPLNNFKLGNCKLNMIAQAVSPYFEDAARLSFYSRLNEINIRGALSMNINPTSNDNKYFYLIESFRQALSNITDLDGYTNWLESEFDKNFSQFREPGGEDTRFTEFVQVYLKDMSFILYVICSQMVLIDPEANTFFSLLQLFTNNYILCLLENQ